MRQEKWTGVLESVTRKIRESHILQARGHATYGTETDSLSDGSACLRDSAPGLGAPHHQAGDQGEDILNELVKRQKMLQQDPSGDPHATATPRHHGKGIDRRKPASAGRVEPRATSPKIVVMHQRRTEKNTKANARPTRRVIMEMESRPTRVKM